MSPTQRLVVRLIGPVSQGSDLGATPCSHYPTFATSYHFEGPMIGLVNSNTIRVHSQTIINNQGTTMITLDTCGLRARGGLTQCTWANHWHDIINTIVSLTHCTDRAANPTNLTNIVNEMNVVSVESNCTLHPSSRFQRKVPQHRSNAQENRL